MAWSLSFLSFLFLCWPVSILACLKIHVSFGGASTLFVASARDLGDGGLKEVTLTAQDSAGSSSSVPNGVAI